MAFLSVRPFPSVSPIEAFYHQRTNYRNETATPASSSLRSAPSTFSRSFEDCDTTADSSPHRIAASFANKKVYDDIDNIEALRQLLVERDALCLKLLDHNSTEFQRPHEATTFPRGGSRSPQDQPSSGLPVCEFATLSKSQMINAYEILAHKHDNLKERASQLEEYLRSSSREDDKCVPHKRRSCRPSCILLEMSGNRTRVLPRSLDFWRTLRFQWLYLESRNKKLRDANSLLLNCVLASRTAFSKVLSALGPASFRHDNSKINEDFSNVEPIVSLIQDTKWHLDNIAFESVHYLRSPSSLTPTSLPYSSPSSGSMQHEVASVAAMRNSLL